MIKTKPIIESEILSVQDLAKALKVSVQTIYRGIREGKYNYTTNATGKVRFTKKEAMRIWGAYA